MDIPSSERYQTVLNQATLVFTEREAALVWLSRPNKRICNGIAPPETACRSAQGFEDAMAELSRLAENHDLD